MQISKTDSLQKLKKIGWYKKKLLHRFLLGLCCITFISTLWKN